MEIWVPKLVHVLSFAFMSVPLFNLIVERALQSGGSGLGLAIAKKLIEAHGGRIWAESAVGQGATFTFILPLDTPTAERIE